MDANPKVSSFAQTIQTSAHMKIVNVTQMVEVHLSSRPLGRMAVKNARKAVLLLVLDIAIRSADVLAASSNRHYK